MGSGFIHHYFFRAYVSILHRHWHCMENRLRGMSFDPIHRCSIIFVKGHSIHLRQWMDRRIHRRRANWTETRPIAFVACTIGFLVDGKVKRIVSQRAWLSWMVWQKLEEVRRCKRRNIDGAPRIPHSCTSSIQRRIRKRANPHDDHGRARQRARLREDPSEFLLHGRERRNSSSWPGVSVVSTDSCGRETRLGHGQARDPTHVDGPRDPDDCHVDPRGMRRGTGVATWPWKPCPGRRWCVHRTVRTQPAASTVKATERATWDVHGSKRGQERTTRHQEGWTGVRGGIVQAWGQDAHHRVPQGSMANTHVEMGSRTTHTCWRSCPIQSR